MAAGGDIAQITFWLQYQAEYGQRICIVGSVPSLGQWQASGAPELEWGEGHKWSVTVDVTVGTLVEYKYVVLESDGLTALQWQAGNNAVLAVMVRSVADRGASAACLSLASVRCLAHSCFPAFSAVLTPTSLCMLD